MNLKEKIENHLVIVVVVMFGAGASLAWFVANEVLVRPRDFTIQQQKETIAELREKIKQQMTSTEKIGKDQKETLEAELRPFLIRLFINQPTTKEVGLWIENHGKGVAHLMPYDIVINGDIKSKHNIRTLADWQTVLKRLGINHPWVEMTAIRRQMTIEPGGSILVLRMKPSEFSKERYQQFIEAIDGMEFLLSYKSSTGKEFIFSFDELNFLP